MIPFVMAEFGGYQSFCDAWLMLIGLSYLAEI